MKKRIFSSMLLLTVIILLALSAALSMVFYRQLSSLVESELRERTAMLEGTVTPENYNILEVSDMRVTIVAADGVVLYDDDENSSLLENHADREEIREALESGAGESHRFSNTLGQQTYYYAVKLADGSILRLAKTTSSIWGVFYEALPIVSVVVMAVIILAYFLAGRLTSRIVRPINNVDLESNLSAPYDELTPFVQAISWQREHISRHLSDIQNRSDTISAIMDSTSEGIILVNGQGAILSVNKSAASIFSISESITGKNILEVLRDIELNEQMRAALGGARGEMTLEQNGKTYRVYLSPATDSGAIILFLDITEKTISEKIRREFSANVSHELKTPLTIIYGNAEMLESGMVKAEDTGEFYSKIKSEAFRLIALIDDIIMLSRLEESGEKHYQEVNLYDVAAEAVESLSPKAKEQNINVTVSGNGTVLASRSQIIELFYNLIDNAIKYNVENGSVTVDISMDGGHAEISISDTGVGIPESAQSRVFERFYRVDQSRSKKTGGTGLGLAIVKHIVMAYDGNIELQSRMGEGTRVTVKL